MTGVCTVPEDVDRVLDELVTRLAPIVEVVGLYVVGSIATGDYVAGVSDIDAVAVVTSPLDHQQENGLVVMHQLLVAGDRAADKLHCYYVAVDQVDDVERPHAYWAGRGLRAHHVSGVTRRELESPTAITVTGRGPAGVIPVIDDDAFRRAVVGDLAGYWTTALGWRTVWFDDFYVDLGLLTLVRAREALRTGRLISKREALGGLSDFGVPGWLAREIRARRNREVVRVSPARRLHRAIATRRLVAAGIERLVAAHPVRSGPDVP
jgi:hypothetical protein